MPPADAGKRSHGPETEGHPRIPVRELTPSAGRTILFHDPEGHSGFALAEHERLPPISALVSTPWAVDLVPAGGEALWLTRLTGTGRVDPRAFEHEILPKLGGAVRAGPRTLVVDDVDYLLLVHGEKEGLRFLKRLADLAIDRGARFIACTGASAGSGGRAGVLESLFEEVRPSFAHPPSVTPEAARVLLTDGVGLRRRIAAAPGPVLAFSPSPGRIAPDGRSGFTPVPLGDGGGRLHPSELPAEGLQRVRKFVAVASDGPRPLVALDSVESLALYHETPALIETLKSLIDTVHAGGGIVILSTERQAWEDRTWTLLTRRVEQVAPSLRGDSSR